MSTTYQLLSEPFPQEMERVVNKGGASLIYIPISEVINRLNKVLGVESWSYEVVGWQQLGTSIVAHVRVTAMIEGVLVTRDGVGGQLIKLSKKTGEPIDIGDELKGAVSDALKKAVQTMGVGLYLARSEEAMEVEQVMESEMVVEQVAQVDPAIAEKWDNFVGISKKLSADQKEKLNDYWNSYSNGQPKPKRETVTEDALDKLLAEATALIFNGEQVVSGQ
jgi:hypothetical protein